MTEMWVIWSEEHGAWWGPREHGYTRSLRSAGRYSKEHAKEIAFDANVYLEIDQFHEIAIPDPLTEHEHEGTAA